MTRTIKAIGLLLFLTLSQVSFGQTNEINNTEQFAVETPVVEE
jgi:hypothetical protein